MPWVQAKRLAEFSLGAIKIAHFFEQASERGVGAGKTRLLAAGLQEAGTGVLELSQALKNIAQYDSREGEIGTQPNGLLAVWSSGFRLTQFQQQLPEVAAGLGRQRVQLRRPAEMVDGTLPIPQQPECVPQIVMSGSEPGIELDRRAKVAARLVKCTQVDERRSEIAVVVGMVGLKRQG